MLKQADRFRSHAPDLRLDLQIYITKHRLVCQILQDESLFRSILPSIVLRFWFKINENPSKNRFQDASHFRSIFPSIFLRFWLHFGSQLGAMLATLGPLGGVLAASWGPLGPSWRPLGASWRPRPTRSEGTASFGGLLGASWPHF